MSSEQRLASAPICRVEQLEPGPAFELALRILAGRRIDVALARLAQEARLDHQVALCRDLLAALLEEDAADRCLARRRRVIRAGPASRIVAVDDRKAKEMRHPPRAGIAARIADEADAAQDAAAVEQHRQDDRMAGDSRSHPPERHRVVDGLADIFAFVVETGIDLVQPVLFRPALAEFRPVQKPLARRAAVAAAGKLAVAIRAHGLRVEPEPQAANFALVVARLRLRREAHEHEREYQAGAANPMPRRGKIGSSVAHSPNTYSIDAGDICLSSGALLITLTDIREPASTATYCLPLTE